jgi:hypothetical protein
VQLIAVGGPQTWSCSLAQTFPELVSALTASLPGTLKRPASGLAARMRTGDLACCLTHFNLQLLLCASWGLPFLAMSMVGSLFPNPDDQAVLAPPSGVTNYLPFYFLIKKFFSVLIFKKILVLPWLNF